MSKHIKTPFLSTSFSESGKSAKKRLGNILSTRKKRFGAVIISVILVAAVAAGAFVTLGAGRKTGPAPEAEVSLAERLYATKHAYVGDASANGRTASALGISAELGGFTNQLQTSQEPYGWRLNFEANPYEGNSESVDKMSAYAAVLLALVDNLGYVEWSYPGNEAAAQLSAEGASKIIGRDIKSAAETPEELDILLSELRLFDYKNEIYTALTKVSLESFMDNALVIGADGVRDIGKLNEFMNMCAMKLPAKLDVVHFTVEGDPLLLRIQTDGDNFWGGEYDGYDSFLDKSAPTYYGFGPYSYLKVMPGASKDSSTVCYYLVNDPELTIEEIHTYLLSSSYTEDSPEFKLLFFLENTASGSESYIYG